MNYQEYYQEFTTEKLIEALPENRPLYKDSGLWQVRSDDMEDVIAQQRSDESFRDFILHYLDWIELYEPDNAETVRINLI